MKKIIYIFLTYLIITGFYQNNSFNLWAANTMILKPGTQYEQGTRVDNAGNGISFVIPKEWIGGQPPNNPAFLLGSNTKQGIGVILMRSQTSLEEIKGLINQPQDFGQGVVLYPEKEPVLKDRQVTLTFTNNSQYKGTALGLIGPNQNGMVVFFAGPQNMTGYYNGLIAKIKDSAQFKQPQTTDMMKQWRHLLAGMMLKRMSRYYSGGVDGTYVGGGSSETLHLCSNGSYIYSNSSDVAADGGGYSGYSGDSGVDRGQWKLEMTGSQVVLTLMSKDGSSSLHSITMNNKQETYFDGQRAYRVKSNQCY